MPGLDTDTIRHALTTAREHGFVQIRLKSGDESFRAVVEPQVENEEAPSMALAEILIDGPQDQATEIKAPCVGYFQGGTEELKVDDQLETGEVVGVINALGLKNDVIAKKGGRIVEVCVTPNQPVEYGQVIARVKP